MQNHYNIMSMRPVIALLSGILILAASLPVTAQEAYVATPVTISKETVKGSDGTLYYSHVVQERQTLYSISKAYGVSVEDIYKANPSLNLEKEGLKNLQIIRIPMTGAIASQENTVQDDTVSEAQDIASGNAVAPAQPQEDEYFIHTVKWFEDLKSISAKYGIPAEKIAEYNGLAGNKLSRRQKLKIPYNVGSEPQEEPEEEAAQEQTDEEVTEEAHTGGLDEMFDGLLFGGKRKVTASLILPLNSKGTPNENQYDFYCGALLAIRDIEREGIKVDLHIHDCAGSFDITESDLEDSDIIIGPISSEDVSKALAVCPENKPIVSPLEPKVLSLTSEVPNLIQAPSASDIPCKELIAWIREGIYNGDQLILFTEKGATPSANATALTNALYESGMTYQTINYGILEGRNIISTLEKYAASEEHTTHILIASESEAFVNDVIRNANTLVFRKHPAIVYCTSRVRNFDTIEVEHFHNTHMHTCASYFIDYDDARVKSFLLAYRALFQSEPGPFAFQGYDTTYLFIKACSQYGRRWYDRIAGERLKGLQSDFLFEKTESGSLVNKAVRRVIYDDGYTVRMAK